MNKRFIFAAISLLLATALTACGQSKEESGVANYDESTPIEVELVVPEAAGTNEALVFTSIVTQGDDLVDDASEVVYEIWKEGQKENSEMIPADQQEGNQYKLTHTFSDDGLYHVQTHVTARGLHRMPTAEIRIGDVKEVSTDGAESDAHEGEDHHDDTTVDVKTDFNGQNLVLQIDIDGQPYTGGEVTLEMWKDGEEKHTWFDTVEISEGTYELKETDDLTGTYIVVVHITDEQVHEHQELELEF